MIHATGQVIKASCKKSDGVQMQAHDCTSVNQKDQDRGTERYLEKLVIIGQRFRNTSRANVGYIWPTQKQ
jgi:hypothetical protein